MKAKPMGMLLMMLAGWINRHQQDVTTRNPCVAGSGCGVAGKGFRQVMAQLKEIQILALG